MLLRTLAVTAVIFMFAQPKSVGFLADWLSGRSTHHFILLDDSFSMNDRNTALGGTPLFDDTLNVVRRIIDSSSKQNNSDRLTLIRLSRANESTAGIEPEINAVLLDKEGIQLVDGFIKELQPVQVSFSPEIMLSAVMPLLQKKSSFGKNAVYFISDFRQRNWTQTASILKKIETIKQIGAAVRLVCAGNEEHPNLAVKELKLVHGIHASDVDILFDASVVNYGREDADGVQLTIRADGKTQPVITIPKIRAGEETQPPVRFPVRLDGAGSHFVEVHLQGDAVSDDNIRSIAVQIPDSLEVLLITPDVRNSSANSPVPYIRTALSPSGTRSGIKTRIETPEFLATRPLEQFPAIFLLDIAELEPSAVKALEEYVQNGGGLAYFAGPNCKPDFLRQELYKNGNGLFPVEPLEPAVLEPDYLSKAPDIAPLGKHPVFRLFEEDNRTLMSSVRVEKYLSAAAVSVAENKDVQIIASLRNNAPLAAEKHFGKGKTVVFLTSASPVWNNWAKGNPGYVVIMLELAAYLSQRHGESNSLTVGEPLQLTFPAEKYESAVRLRFPKEEGGNAGTKPPVQIDGTPDGTSIKAVFTSTERSGIYRTELTDHSGKKTEQLFAVNVDPSEGDIRLTDFDNLSALLKPLYLRLESAAGFSAPFEFTGNQPWSDLLLYALLLLLIGETFLAGKMLRG
ncbi:hypothetical protein FACS189427_08280 [Planctomycetales bacterium]|nr:hypothetical protein FACS189427_08280 [Planctomycetales bacterium]